MAIEVRSSFLYAAVSQRSLGDAAESRQRPGGTASLRPVNCRRLGYLRSYASSAHRMVASLATAMLLSLLPLGAAAHDIPNDVRVQAFVKPGGQRLQLLVRGA